MKYYYLDTSTKTGNTAILAGNQPHWDWESPVVAGNIKTYELPDFEPIFSELIFKRYYRMVDFFCPDTMGGRGFGISERIKKVLEDFDLMEPNRVYALPPYTHKELVYQYYYLQLVPAYNSFPNVNFEKSEFVKTDFYKENPNTIEINSDEEFLNQINKTDDLKERIIASKIVLKNKPPDLFCIHRIFNHDFLISEKLRDALLEIKATGLKDFVEEERIIIQ